MKIKVIKDKIGDDFWADQECEFCGYVEKDVSGYDDWYYHHKVLPKKECPKCGKASVDCGSTTEEVE